MERLGSRDEAPRRRTGWWDVGWGSGLSRWFPVAQASHARSRMCDEPCMIPDGGFDGERLGARGQDETIYAHGFLA